MSRPGKRGGKHIFEKIWVRWEVYSVELLVRRVNTRIRTMLSLSDNTGTQNRLGERVQLVSFPRTLCRGSRRLNHSTPRRQHNNQLHECTARPELANTWPSVFILSHQQFYACFNYSIYDSRISRKKIAPSVSMQMIINLI